MTALKKTPARLRLLQAVADGAVFQDWTGNHLLDRGPGLLPRARYLHVGGLVRMLSAAGYLGGGTWNRVDLTDSGRALLAEWSAS